MAFTKRTTSEARTEIITVNGDNGAEFELYVKQGTKYYNFDTNSFSSTEFILKKQLIPSSGKYQKKISIPSVSSDTSYNFFIRTSPNTNLQETLTHDQKIGTLFQKATKTATFTTTDDTTLSIASALTGGTLTVADQVLNQTGAITEASGNLVYIHSIPTWDLRTGGAWTLSNLVEETVTDVRRDVVYVEDGTNIASGYSVDGENIVDEITVSAISGNKITLSAAQRIEIGDVLRFSKSGWEFKNIYAKLTTGSGTTSVTMSNVTEVAKVGIANIACELDIDEYVSIKPNAFPVNVNVPAGTATTINPIDECTNYLGQTGDIDANVETKTYKIHSVPSNSTSSSSIDGEFGTIDLAADEVMGSAGTASVVYTPHDAMVAGHTDHFYYKTTDAQSSPQTSSTTQGKISITIV